MDFVAEFRYKDTNFICELWRLANDIHLERNRPLPVTIEEVSFQIQSMSNRYVSLQCEFLKRGRKLVERILLTDNVFSLEQISKIVRYAICSKPNFAQIEYGLRFGLERVKEILKEYRIANTIRERCGTNSFICNSRFGNKTLNKEQLTLCYDSEYEDSIWIEMHPDEVETRLFFEPNQFQKGWKERLVQSIASIIVENYSAGL